MAADDEPTRLTIAEAGRLIAAHELSPVELTEAYLARIERYEPLVNAYVTINGESALDEATALEAELAAGANRGPLHGIPIGLKDNIDTAGVHTTAGSAVYADRVPSEDAPVALRLREAGAIALGKLNMHEFAYGGTTAITAFGPTHNPWDLDHIPGGSSGGSAAAVAARLCAGALGTDTAASVRLPAAWCGVVGLKATHGLASIRGIVPLSESHDHVGPLAKTVDDAALVMQAIAGFDPLDPVSIDAGTVRLPGAAGAPVAGLRVGIPRHPFYDELDADIDAAVTTAIAVLESLTAGVTEVAFPLVDSWPVLSAEIYAYHAALVADPATRSRYDPITLERILGGAGVSATEYIGARRAMAVARNTAGDLFTGVDVLVAPTSMQPPGRIDAALDTAPDEHNMIRNTLPFNVYGIPAISVPCGFTRAGLPVGLQIAGPPLGEAVVLALAHAYEQATDWHRCRDVPIVE